MPHPDFTKLMSLEVQILYTSDFLDRKVARVAEAWEDKLPVPAELVPQIREDIANLRGILDELEQELVHEDVL